MLHDVARDLQVLKHQRLRGVPGWERRAKATALLAPARSLPTRSVLAAVMLEIADASLPDDADTALSSAREARGLISAEVAPNLAALALVIEAEALLQQGDAGEAHALLQLAVPLAERQRRQVADPVLRATSMLERIRVYDAAVRAALAVGDLQGALATSELARPKFGAAPVSITIAGLRAALAEDEVLIAYHWLADDRLLVTVVERTGYEATQQHVPLEALAVLDRLSRHLRNAGDAGWTLEEDEVAGLDLLTPVLLTDVARAAMGRRRKLVFLCHRALHAVPLGLLRVEGGRLGLRHPLSVIPNLAALDRPVPVAPERGAIAIGIGTYPKSLQLPAFPVVAKAVVARHREAGLPAELVEEERARAAFLRLAESGALERCGFLLLACHGTSVMGDEPDRSFLLMGAERLHAGTLGQLPLRADLVVMAACCSGQRAVGGRDFSTWPGDDLFGLQAALCDAGARQVIGALWNADEGATASMAATIHRTWLAGADAAEAVYAGATELVRDPVHAELRDWAPFVAIVFGRAAAAGE